MTVVSHPERRPAVVTGASSGIGQATAIALALAGYPVVLGARRLERCERTAVDIRANGGEALALPLDLTDSASVETFAERANDELGPIEIIISNAGDVMPLSAIEAPPDEFERQMRINLLGPQRLLHHLAPAMIGRGRGDLVFVTSEVAHTPRPHMASYVAAKSGLEGLARAMRMELEGTGVRVGVVRPGPSSTEQGSTWDAATIRRIMKSWGEWGLLRHDAMLQPADVAAAVVAMVAMPRGTQLAVLEVQPEAPVTAGSQPDPESEVR